MQKVMKKKGGLGSDVLRTFEHVWTVEMRNNHPLQFTITTLFRPVLLPFLSPLHHLLLFSFLNMYNLFLDCSILSLCNMSSPIGVEIVNFFSTPTCCLFVTVFSCKCELVNFWLPNTLSYVNTYSDQISLKRTD